MADESQEMSSSSIQGCPMASPKIPIRSDESGSSHHHNTSTPPVEENTGKTSEPIEIKDNMSNLQKAPGNDGFLSADFSLESNGSATEKDKSEKGSTGYDKSLTNSQGKVKKFKCRQRQCDFFSITQLDYWKHIKTHIEPDKALSCPSCPFVTKHKHHMKYHLNNHAGSKPFKCSKCEYSCVSQSMLNSHMKSHSNIYQYRCASCSFASKYCHALKLHLRKKSHSPAMVLNPDGTPNPLLFVDVYGTRRVHEINIPKQDPSPNPNPEPITLRMQAISPERNVPNGSAPNSEVPDANDSAEEEDDTEVAPFLALLNVIPNLYSIGVESLRRMIAPQSNVPNGSPPNSEVPNTNDSAEKKDDKEDERTYTTIFDIVEVVSDETEDKGESLKLYSSEMLLDQDSNPHLASVNVNGTRRGPEIDNPDQRPAAPNPNVLPVAALPLNQVLENAANMSNQIPDLSFYTQFANGSSSPLMIEIDKLTRKMQAVSNRQFGPSVNTEINENCVLNLRKREPPNKDDSPEGRDSTDRVDTAEPK